MKDLCMITYSPKLRRALLATIGGMLLMASAARAAPASGPDLSGVTLRVGIFEDVTRDAAEASGFFKDLPYHVTWARLNGAGPTVQALGGGAIDISWGLSDTAAAKASSEDHQNWTAQNAPIKLIALLQPFDRAHYSLALIGVHKDSGIKTFADLRGKTYAYNEGGNANALGLLALAKAGLTVKDVQLRLLTYDATSSALVSGAVAAAPVTRARVADALADGTIRELATDYATGFPGFTSVTARTDALADPKLSAAIGDFLSRTAHYLRWASTHDQEVAKSYVKSEQLTPQQAGFAAKSGAATLIPLDAKSDAYQQEVVATKTLAEIGFYPRPVDFSTVVDDRFTAAIAAGNAAP
jgi:sulfonate transport system substrate-binding protein